MTPSHYDLVIKTDLKNFTFSGTAEITIDVRHEVPSIVLYVAEPVQIRHAVLWQASLNGASSKRLATNFKLDAKRERVEIVFAGGNIAPGRVRLGLRWESQLTDSLQGYYRSDYPAPEGKAGDKADPSGHGIVQAYYAITEIQPIAARQAFPCFDKPTLKATFTIQMISRTDSVSLSNMDVRATKHLGAGGNFPRTALLDDSFFAQDGPAIDKTILSSNTSENPAHPVSHGDFKNDWTLTTFSTTPKVSTYLVAYANGPFVHLESSFASPISGRVIPLRVYATADCIEQGALALETMEQVLPIYEKMFDVEYPLPKLDSLVVSDFQGAMENWGLIVAASTAYLYDPKKNSIKDKKRVVSVNSHEIAHQWFGNIVTFDWWDGLWLNEAFATMVSEVLVLDVIEPSWRVHSAFVKKELADAFRLDALPSSHPIQMPCPDEDTINQIFDSISYNKGAGVLRMLSNFIGQDTFIRGVSIYLKRFLYGNSITKDLWDGVSEASGKDIAALMENWTLKVGFPVVSVEETADGLKVRQNRFLSTHAPTPEEDAVLWHVPLQLLIVRDGHASVDHELLLTEREIVIPIKDIANVTYKLNAGMCGVYRTSYSQDRLIKLGHEAGRVGTHFDLSDRVGLVGDATALAMAGVSKTSGALSFLSELGNEKENLVLHAVADSLATLATTWWEQPQEVRTAIAKFRRTLFSPIAERLGFDNSADDDVDTVELRATAIATAAATGDAKILAEYRRRFAPFLEKNDESIISLRPAQQHLLGAPIKGMCATQDEVRLERVFSLLKSDDTKTNDILVFTKNLAINPMATRTLWQFLQDHYDHVARRFKAFTIKFIISQCFQNLTTEEDALAVEAWAKGVDSSTWNQALGQGLDRIRSNAKWLARDAQDVEGWLKENGYLQ
ncbi:BQ2448_4986 [Microbotryum intermedium]|uniref:Aminopeptidase n=1 Tax=Microbotryum intermedium TaxID=269621 RepID=A0A238FEP4_9BASI|nr:BQ2448_4986 [Microbotryum intermedium]